MAIKIVQSVGILTTSVSTAATTRAIALQSGYLRVSTGYTGAYVAIGTEPIVTKDSFHIPSYSTEVIKETLKKQGIAGITTGTTTIVSFDQNLYGSFEIGDYVTIQNASPSEINIVHVPVISVTNSNVELQYDSSSITGVSINGTSTLARSVKIAALGDISGGQVSISEVVQLVTE